MEESNKHRAEGKVKRNQESPSEEEEEQVQGGEHYESSFVVSEDQEGEGYYGHMTYRDRDSDEGSEDRRLSKKEKKKRKKKSKKHKKEKKAKRVKELDEDDFDQDDLDVIDNNENKLTRLKKKVKPHESEDQFQNYRDDDGDVDDFVSEGEEAEQYSAQRQESDQEYSSMNEILERPMDVLDPNDMKHLKPADQAEILETDLPERYINLCKSNFRGGIRKVQQVKDLFEKEDMSLEANWIFQRMKTQGSFENYYDEQHCKDRIKKILEFIHKDHLEIMYIYYYRKNVYSDYLSIEHLWKIEELDQEWHSFREKQKKYQNLLVTFYSSYTDLPGQIKEMLLNLHDFRSLKYFEDYDRFMKAKHASVESFDQKLGDKSLMSRRQRQKNKAKGNIRLDFLEQMVAKRGVIDALEYSQICLTPQMLCHNMSKRGQERKPTSPINEPKDEFQRIIGSDNPETDKIRFPLLVGENRFKTITKYLSYELFTYPELRKILKEKYFKRLVISSNPTESGSKDIDLYHPYFPIKRLKDKPIQTLKRQLWTLARKAEREGLIKLDLKFQWQITATEKIVSERDQVYMEIIKNYYDLNNTKSSQIWNLFRKRVISTLLNQYFIPSFMKQVKEQLSQEGQKEIISSCCVKLRQQLNKGPSMKEGKPIKILALVLEDTKLGVAFVDQTGKALHSFQTIIANDQMLKDFVGGQNLKFNIKEFKPDMILISANCKKAQTLRKELRTPDLFPETIFCAFGQYQVPRLAAKKRIISGLAEEESILEAISMARLKQNPMAEIIALWSPQEHKNGILSMNLHPYQKFVNQQLLTEALERVVIEIVNLVGVNINDIKKNEHLQAQLRFVCGLGDIRSKNLLDSLRSNPSEVLNRKYLGRFLKGQLVCKNCFPFLKIQSSFHKHLFEKLEKEKKGHAILEYQHLNLLEMTRIPEQWHKYIFRKLNDSFKSTTITDMRSRKTYAKLSDENIFLLEIFKNGDKVRSIDWRVKDNNYFDEELVKSELVSRFKNTRDPERVMENREIFYSLLKETPDTLKRYSLLSVKVLSIKKNYLNVIIPQNGLFGYIRLQSNKTAEEYEQIYEKGQYIKAVLIGFPFDERSFREQQPTEEQELLKVEMALDLPHKDNVDRHENMRHDCMVSCFPTIVKAIHPNIDLEKDRFQLKKEDKPVLENKEDKEKERFVVRNIKPDFRRISHPKYKNIDARQAVQMLKNQPVGDFVIRPSSQGPEYLTITWKFFGKVMHHIKIRCEHKSMNTMSMTYRIEDRDNRSYNSLEEIVQKYIKPMNALVQDVTSNRKFLDRTVEEIQNTIKTEMSADSSHIYYFFGVSEQFPQFFLLIYMYREKKPIRELIKVKNSGLYFHEQQFANIRDLTTWFKQHLKEKEYQRYVKTINAQLKPR